MVVIHFHHIMYEATQYTRKRTDLKSSSFTYYFVSLTSDLIHLGLVY